MAEAESLATTSQPLPSLNGEAMAVDDFIRALEEHRIACEKQGKYVEAEVAKNRLEELLLHEENRLREAMRAQHAAERMAVEQGHMQEQAACNEMWERRLLEYDSKAKELLEAMQERHASELAEMRRKHAEEQPKPKWSRELLNLRKIEEAQAKQKSYAEAHKTKQKADTMEALELQKFLEVRQLQFSGAEAKLLGKHQVELDALTKRIVSGRDEQRRQAQADLERLGQRYTNAINALEKAQQIARQKHDKGGRTKSILSTTGSLQELGAKPPPSRGTPAAGRSSVSRPQSRSIKGEGGLGRETSVDGGSKGSAGSKGDRPPSTSGSRSVKGKATKKAS
eukprot:jgi/Mesvir1/11760/Mv00130-RA.1